MSKEEILDNQRHGFNSGQKDSALKAMDEYAKEQAIAFRDWSRTSAASVYGGNTTDQLYQMFIEHQKQQSI